MHTIQQKLLDLANTKQISSLTLQELADFTGAKYRQSVKHHLNQLVLKGFLTTDSSGNYHRAKQDNQSSDSLLISIPVYGSANAGPALLFANDTVQGYLQISKNLVNHKKSLIAVKVDGLSMDRAAIKGQSVQPGDYVLVDTDQKTPIDGDYVLSVINGAANIKRFFRDTETNTISLVSESSRSIPPIVISPDQAEEYFVAGKIVRVIKSFQKRLSK